MKKLLLLTFLLALTLIAFNQRKNEIALNYIESRIAATSETQVTVNLLKLLYWSPESFALFLDQNNIPNKKIAISYNSYPENYFADRVEIYIFNK